MALLLAVVPYAAVADGIPGLASSGHRNLTFAVLTDVNGWISSSAINPDAEPHGLAHLLGPLRRLRAEHPGVVVIALGDWLTGAPAPVNASAALSRLAEVAGVAAALPGERDLPMWMGRRDRAQGAPPLPWIASDLHPLAGIPAHRAVQGGGLRIGIIGLTRPGIVASTRLRRAGLSVRSATSAAGEALAAATGEARPDLTVALVNGAWDSAEEQSTALVEGVPVRHGVQELTDGSIPVDVVIARSNGRRRGQRPEVSVDTVPTAHVAPGLTLLRVILDEVSGRWRVNGLAQETVAPESELDPQVLSAAGASWSGLGPWLAEPTRAVVSGYNRKADFMVCAGELSHAAVVAAVRARGGSSGAAPITLLPQLWRFEPLRKRHRGQPVTRGQLYRWMPHDDGIVPAQLTGRQMALLLEPYARYRGGWHTSPSLVLHPGGIEALIPGRATQPSALTFAASGAAVAGSGRYAVWLSAYHADGAGGLARRALIQAGQMGTPGDQSLRELVFQWMASTGFTVPEACAAFLQQAPAR